MRVAEKRKRAVPSLLARKGRWADVTEAMRPFKAGDRFSLSALIALNEVLGARDDPGTRTRTAHARASQTVKKAATRKAVRKKREARESLQKARIAEIDEKRKGVFWG